MSSTHPTTPSTYTDPYRALPKDDKSVTTVVIGNEDKSVIMAVNPHQGVLQKTIAILLSRLTAQLLAQGITSYNPAAYEKAVGGLKVELGEI